MNENEKENEQKHTPENQFEGNKENQENTGQSSIDQVTGVSALAYLIFFLPLLTNRDSKFAMFHANQGLNLFITAVAVNIIGSVIPVIGWFLIAPLGMLFVIVLGIMGIIHALNGEEKELPLIGGFRLLK